MRPKILHITSWFDHAENGSNPIFVKNQIEALNPFSDNDVLQVTCKKSIAKFLKPEQSTQTKIGAFNFKHVVIGTLSGRWREIEYSVFRFLREFIKKNVTKYDIINFCIAYPNATRIDYFNKKFPKIKFTITEHWSAYHGNFNLPANSKGRARIAKIFDHGNNLIVVSDALGIDIQKFTGKKTAYTVVPNILETKLFSFCERKLDQQFKMASINFWTEMKNPFVLMDAVKILRSKGRDVSLTLGGEGMKFNAIKKYLVENDMSDAVTLTGNLSRTKVISLLADTHLYLQSSVYETFSVICLEALATGCPVVAHKVGGMPEFINKENGILVDDLSVENWTEAIEQAMSKYQLFDQNKISENVRCRFSEEKVGYAYYLALTKGWENKNQTLNTKMVLK